MNYSLQSIYYCIRPLIPLWLRWALQAKAAKRIDGLSSTPIWPIAADRSCATARNWPGGFPSALVLSHDVDTRLGYDSIADVCEVEKRLGLVSSWNIVPNLYEIDQARFDHLRLKGMEIGVHDWNHDGKLFSNKAIFDQRIGKINRVISEWGVKGFRAGMVFHNDDWMQALECEYDSSYYDTDPYQPMGGGSRFIEPFMLGNLVELPYTMPQDHTLFVACAELKVTPDFFGQDNNRMRTWRWIKDYILKHYDWDEKSPFVISGIEIWKMKARWLFQQGGMVLMLTHPDYLCHPKLKKKVKSRQYTRSKKKIRIRDGWLDDEDRDIQAVRQKSVVEEKWFGSLLEQYAAFLSWFKEEFEGQYWHCLPRKMAVVYKKSLKNATTKAADAGFESIGGIVE